MSHQGETQIASVLGMINMMAGSLGLGGEEEGWRKGPWTGEEDKLLTEYVRVHGEGRWNSVARLAGLKRNGKSCRLRWVNYLRPDLKRGQITPHEESLIMELHAKWGNRWSTIARSLPGRTDNEIKNYWRTHFKKRGKSTQNSDKAKSRILKRQQQKKLLMQQQLQQRQQQEQQFQIDDIQDQGDLQYFQTLIKAMGSDISSPLQDQEVGDHHNHGVVSIPHHEYYRPEMAFNLINPMLTGTNTSLDQCCLSPIYQGGICGVADHGLAEEGIWGSLWNLDDGNNCGSIISKGAIQIANFYPEYII